MKLFGGFHGNRSSSGKKPLPAETEEQAPYLYTHPDNTEGTLAGEAALYIPRMREEGCEFIIACCFGDNAVPEDKAEARDWIHPVKLLARESEGIDLLITSCEGSQRPGKSELRNRDRKTVHVLYSDDELSGCLFSFSENRDGDLVFSRKGRIQ